MKRVAGFYFLVCFLFSFSLINAQTVTLLQENFTAYVGTSATIPSGWTFSYNGNYTSTTYSGVSGPNAYKFGTTGATIITPAFSNADSVSFWIKGASTDAASYLTVYETSDSITWNQIVQIKPLPATGTPYQLAVQPASTHLKFVYFKSAGNLAFDDFLVVHYVPYFSSGDIKIYFNQPVNNSVSKGVNAVYLNQTLDDTLVAYINRTKYSLDIAVYDYVQSGNIANISAAVNNAYNRGVKVRWIYNGSSSNSGLSSLDTNIHTLGSPTLSNYGIMHNKFMVADANSVDGYDPIVWTGSCNWNTSQFYYDVNNTIIVQDKYLALAYTKEFEEMWGDTGLVPNAANSKFGSNKLDNTQHLFTIGGRTVELYFSPSDNTNDKIISSISTANSDLYFGMYAFTFKADADSIKNKIQSGVYAAGIMDQFSQSYTTYTTLQPVMGNNLKLYTSGSSLYHNKFLIVDECDSLSDPLVLTGSHNWSSSADSKNDENTLILHDDTIANIYYQSFYQNFLDLGSALPSCIQLGVPEIAEEEITVFPNPSGGKIRVAAGRSSASQCTMEIYNMLGKKIYAVRTDYIKEGIDLDLSSETSGVYFLLVKTKKEVFSKKIIIR